MRTGGRRCLYVDTTVADGVCHGGGECHAFGAKAQATVKVLCDHDVVNHTLLRGLKNPQFLAPRTLWVNAGFWFFQD